MFSYISYGLGIHSVLPLPELVPRQMAADVTIRLGEVDCSRLEAVDEYHSFGATSEEACYAFRGVGTFLIRGGCEIFVDPAPGVDEQLLRLALLGPVIALVFLQRRQFVLHASAVAIAGRAVAFLGGQGWGKSTMSAALHAQGHPMLTDDVTAIDFGPEEPLVVPGFPQFKLWPEAAMALGKVPEVLPSLHPDVEKRALRINRGYALTCFPLRRLYVLAKGPACEVEPLKPQEALIELMQHSYAARFGQTFFRVIGLKAYFQQCVNLANKIPVFRLKRQPCLSLLPEVVRVVEDDVFEATQK